METASRTWSGPRPTLTRRGPTRSIAIRDDDGPGPLADDARAAWRDEWGRLLALLVAQYRRLDLAEDGLGDAFEGAARTWPGDGVPHNPRPGC